MRGLEVQRAELASRNEVLKRVVSLKDNMHPVSPVQVLAPYFVSFGFS